MMKKTETKKYKPRKSTEFLFLMKETFDYKRFNALVSRAGLPTQDARDLLQSYKKFLE